MITRPELHAITRDLSPSELLILEAWVRARYARLTGVSHERIPIRRNLVRGFTWDVGIPVDIFGPVDQGPRRFNALKTVTVCWMGPGQREEQFGSLCETATLYGGLPKGDIQDAQGAVVGTYAVWSSQTHYVLGFSLRTEDATPTRVEFSPLGAPLLEKSHNT